MCAIRRGADATVLASDFTERARMVIASCEDREAGFTKGLILHRMAETCMSSPRWIGVRATPAEPAAPSGQGNVVALPAARAAR